MDINFCLIFFNLYSYFNFYDIHSPSRQQLFSSERDLSASDQDGLDKEVAVTTLRGPQLCKCIASDQVQISCNKPRNTLWPICKLAQTKRYVLQSREPAF